MTTYEEFVHEESSNEYATKPDLWRPLSRQVDGFDVDPAAGVENEQIAETVYTKKDDGLSKSWNGTVWLNPPFGDKMDWFRKAVNEVNCGNAETLIAIAPVDTGADWFQRWFAKAEVLGWLDGRDWYVDNGSPPFNTVVGVFGECPTGVVSVLESKGVVTKQVETSTQETLI